MTINTSDFESFVRDEVNDAILSTKDDVVWNGMKAVADLAKNKARFLNFSPCFSFVLVDVSCFFFNSCKSIIITCLLHS